MKKTLSFLMLMLFCIGFAIAKPANTELARHWALDFSNTGNRTTLGLNPSACVDIPSYNYSITPGLSWYTTSSSIVAGDCKIFRVSVSPNESYTFKTGCGDGATATFDTKLYLYDNNGTLLTSNDDNCESNRSQITYTTPSTYSGYLYLKVTGYNNSEYGSFTLAYIKNCTLAPPAFDFNITPDTTHRLHSSTTSDDCGRIYKFYAEAGKTYYFANYYLDDDDITNSSYYLKLYDNNGNEIEGEDHWGRVGRVEGFWITSEYDNQWAAIEYYLYYIQTSGYYYLKVPNINEESEPGYDDYRINGLYTLSYKIIDEVPECPTVPSFNGEITPTRDWTNLAGVHIRDSCTQKIYRFRGVAGNTYNFRTSAVHEARLYLYNSNGIQVASSSSSSGMSYYTELEYTPSYSGYWYLKIDGVDNIDHYTYFIDYKMTGCPCDFEITPTTSWKTHASSTTASTCTDRRLYRVNVTAGDTYTFKTGCDDGATANFDTKLYLYDSTGTQIGYDDDGCNNTRSKIEYTPTFSGAAYLSVTGFGTATGSYTLAYQKVCSSIPNYNFEITPSSSWRTHSASTIGRCNNKNIYRIYVSAGDTYVFKTGCGDGGDADFDTKLYLFNGNGTQITYNDDGCSHNSSYIEYTPTTTGYVFLEVRGYNDATGHYTLAYHVDCSSTTIPEYNYVIAPTASWQTHSAVTYPNCNKTYRLSVTANNSYTFKTGCGDGATANYDTRLLLYDGNGNLIISNDDGCDSSRSKIEYTPTSSGYLYLSVRGWSNSTGNYTLAYREVVPCGITVADLPYTEYFDSYTSSTSARTGVEPPCWTLAHQYVTMTDEEKPMISCSAENAHSGSYNLLLNGRCIYAMPYYEGDVSTLQMQFYLRQRGTNYRLQVGVMADLSDPTTFVPVATFNNSTTTEVSLQTVDFSSYMGSGHYIAFKNILPSGNSGAYSRNYIDDITLEQISSPCGITVADLPYAEDFESHTTSTDPRTGVEPPCWTLAHQYVTMTDEEKPMISCSADNAHSGSYNLLLNYRCIYAMPYFEGDVSTLQMQFYLRQRGANYRLQVGVMSDLSDPTSFVPVATFNNSTTTEVSLQTVDFSSYTGTGHYIAFKNILPSGNSGAYSRNYIDDITLSQNVTYTVSATANPTEGGTVTGVGTYPVGTTCTLSATPASGYEFTNWTVGGTVVSTEPSYTFTVTADLVLTANFEPTTPCGITVADLPYTEDFESHTTSTDSRTGVEPPCWTLAHQYVAMTDADKPMISYSADNAHSGSYNLLLNYRCIYAMPYFEGDVSTLQMQFYLRQRGANYRLQVGVMSDLSDPTSFVPVATFNNSTTTEVSLQTVDFSSYTGTGHYIAFKNILPSGNSGAYSRNYIDDITLEQISSPCGITVADLPYTEDFESHTTSTDSRTGVEPPCWTLAHQYVAMTDADKPMISYSADNAHSGSYNLLLNYRCIYAMPYFEGDVSTLQMQFYLRQRGANYRLQVGVMSDLSDPTSFVPVATFNNSTTTEVSLQTVDFSSYTGTGHYIAFKNILPSGNSGAYSRNYIDDITLEQISSPCGITVANLPYTEDFESHTTSTDSRTGVEPPCWTLAHQYVTMTDEEMPMISCSADNAHSGSYNLLLNSRVIYAMPYFEGDVNTLQMQFYLRQRATNYRLQVGVMSDLSDPTSFVPVATFNNSTTTEVSLQTVDFSSYSGTGHYIAFKNILPSGNSGAYSRNYIDDVTLMVAGAKGGQSDNRYTMPENHELAVYPNPTTGKLTIEADEEVQRVDVFDYTGRCVVSFEKQAVIDLGRLASGLYTLRMTLPDRIEVRRVVKQ